MREQKLFPQVPAPEFSSGQLAGLEQPTPASGELAETEAPLSLSGSQLRMLALSDMLVRDYENRIFEKSKPGRWLTRIVRNPQTVRKNLVNAVTSNRTDVAQKIVSSLPANDPQLKTLFLAEITDPTTTVDEVLDTSYDKEFLQFYGKNHIGRSDPPEEKRAFTVPELGIHPTFIKERDTLLLSVRPFKGQRFGFSLIHLPLSEQKVRWTPHEEIYGSTEEAVQSQLEVFGEIAKNSDSVYTHITGEVNLPGYLRSESWGTSTLRGAEAAARKLTGMMFEDGKLAPPESYEEASKGGPLPTKRTDGKPSFVSSHYLSPGITAPIILFDSKMTERRETTPCAGGRAVIGTSTFEDPSLIGIWVTPTFRQNLLEWIASWPEAEVKRIFKSRSPESILISTAEQVPKQEA